MTLPVYIDTTLTQISPGDVVQLSAGEAHHAATVRRTRVGEHIDVVNGRGLRVTIAVTAVSKTELVGSALAVEQDQPHGAHITLVQALAKGGRDEQAVETATEYGADSFIPWQAERSIVSWSDPAKARKGQAKWEASAIAAAKQSRRSWVPQVRDVVSSKELAQYISQVVADGGRVFVCHETASQTLVSALDQLGEHIVLIVGPEGGITDQEREMFLNAGAQIVLLGQNVLRSATAGPWAIAVIRANA
ncbi:16S rRNA (uracil(1498)-N(3))-methyltransferase [Arcanobacterium pinnipediorum]|uniref:Ribosomal RNA small subunit methyltransferase E n=1 Tax=Arcanobacterium pinnipediorum TaxID=1503041 RepID=A0ABY5AHR1_9ACTO|nr:16S rRNA (uracil(1498)-N(3))-methyltransferase [Arcanobacterium pinnipediorum]USR78743.1 16S rRNA (uracil(1498)-N(3))-methyltransferase [Arcanobacterium pinnipediorum]